MIREIKPNEQELQALSAKLDQKQPNVDLEN